MRRARAWPLLMMLWLLPQAMFAGGPLLVGGPKLGTEGQPITWNPARMPIAYRVDPGPMAKSGLNITISNSAGLSRLQSMFSVWSSASSALSFHYAGPLLAAGGYIAGADVITAKQYNDLEGSCQAAVQSPVIFDADGSLLRDLGLSSGIIGFAGPCLVDSTGYIASGLVVMNGVFQDGINTYSNYELTANEFDEAIVHEMGHFLGLDHSQINLELLNAGLYPCDPDILPGLPVMFPLALCQARKDAGLAPLAPDDTAWISMLYPGTSTASSYGTISGRIYFSDEQSQAQGVNVIARAVDDPYTPQDESRQVAFSAISGLYFTGNPGQSFTANMADPNEDNTGGDLTGSRDPTLIGYYEIPVLPGTYTVEVESIYGRFISDSSIGPLVPPVLMPADPEFWNKDESAFDYNLQRDTVTVPPGGKITGIDIILNDTPKRFDGYEDPGARLEVPPMLPRAPAAEVEA